MAITGIVTAAGEFVPSGGDVDDVSLFRVVLDRNPDERTERYSFEQRAIVAKSDEEIATELAAAKVTAARKVLGDVPFLPDVLAAVSEDIAPLLNLTAAQLQARWSAAVVSKMVARDR